MLARLRKASYVSAETLIVVEASLETDFSYLEEMGYRIIKEKNTKQTGICFCAVWREKENENSCLSGNF